MSEQKIDSEQVEEAKSIAIEKLIQLNDELGYYSYNSDQQRKLEALVEGAVEMGAGIANDTSKKQASRFSVDALVMPTEDYAEDLNLKKMLEYAVSEGQRALQNFESVDRSKNKIAKKREAIDRNDRTEYGGMLKKDLHLEKQGLKHFEQDKQEALKEFLRLVNKIEQRWV